MAQKTALLFNTVCIPEVAREMISSGTFNRRDIITIGREQTACVFAMAPRPDCTLFCDTDVPRVSDGLRDLGKDEQRKVMLTTFTAEPGRRNASL